MVKNQRTSETKGNKRNKKIQRKGIETKQMSVIGKKNTGKGSTMNRKKGTRKARKKRHI
jgi:hypothetical protein